MVRATIRRLCMAFMPLLMIGALSACAILDNVADSRIGPACTDEVRYDRAVKFTEVLNRHYGDEFPDQLQRLHEKTELMQKAFTAGAGLDAAGDSYKGDFVILAGKILLKRGVEVKLGGFEEATEKLKRLPHLAADINEVEALIKIACARSRGGAASTRTALA